MVEQNLLLSLQHLRWDLLSIARKRGGGGSKTERENEKERVKKRGRQRASHPKEALFIPQGNCITYWSLFPASNGHRGWNCWWQMGNSYESNKESLRHKSQVSHLRTSHLPSHSSHNAGCLNSYTYRGVRLPKQQVHRLRRAFVSITALILANKQRRQTIILHYIHDYSTLHFLSA